METVPQWAEKHYSTNLGMGKRPYFCRLIYKWRHAVLRALKSRPLVSGRYYLVCGMLDVVQLQQEVERRATMALIHPRRQSHR